MTTVDAVQLLGYAGSVLVAISMMMNNIWRLRWINLMGAIGFATYGLMIGARPVFLLNSFIIVVNLIYLIRISRRKDAFSFFVAKADSGFLREFLQHWKDDIELFFPGFDLENLDQPMARLILRNMNPVGAFICEDEGNGVAGIRLAIPPLRERFEDLHVLVDHFLETFAGTLRTGDYRLSREARDAIVLHEWPGNVRELRNVLEGAAFFARADGVIRPEHLGRHVVGAVDGDRIRGLPRKIEELERGEITSALGRTQGNKTQAARLLGVTRKGLGDRIRRLGLDEG